MARAKNKLSLPEMEAQAGKAAAMLKALSHECRLLILCNLVSGEKTVSQLNERIELSQSALSQHLARLRKDGLVTGRKEAQAVYYSIASDDARKVVSLMYDLYCQ
ncbi:MAG: ArsR/SmtB family transcription factor [Saccharospirillum sp.]